MLEYYVAYNHPRGSGCVNINRETPLNTARAIYKLAEEIAKKEKVDKVVIIYIKELIFE